MSKKTVEVPKRLARRIARLEKELFLAFNAVAREASERKDLTVNEYNLVVYWLTLEHIKQFADMTLQVLSTAMKEFVEGLE